MERIADERPLTRHPAGEPTRHPMRRKAMPARRMVATFYLTLLFAALLNAPSILHTADSQDSGAYGTTARVLATPLRWFGEWMGLDLPRHALDRALGGGRVVDETEPTVPTTSPVPAAADEASTTTTVPPVAHEVWIGGDSIVYDVGNALATLANQSDAKPHVEVDSKISTGLARPDKFNWPKEVATQMQERNPAVAVFMVGGNDNQDMRGGGKDWTMSDDANWQTEYARRVGVTMDLLTGPAKRPVVWIGMPIVANGADANRFSLQNAIYKNEAKKRPSVTYIDLWKVFSDKRGAYNDFLPGADGQGVKMRVADGMHFTEAGGMRAARAAWPTIQKLYAAAIAADAAGTTTSAPSAATAPPPTSASGATTSGPTRTSG